MTSYARPRATLLALALAAVIPPAIAAESFPNRPITLIVPFAPGGNIDITARTISGELSKALGQTVVVENRAGAGGVIGATHVARAKPDGYTLLLGNSGPNAVANAVSKRVPYDGVKSFTPIGIITTNPSVLTMSTAIPASDFAQFRQFAQAQPNGVSMGIAGYGSYTHLVSAMINAEAGLNATIVPYKGTGPATTDLIGHQLHAMVDQITTAAPLIRDGRVKALGVMGATRSPLLPDVPTLVEQGYPQLQATIYTGLFAPADLPQDINTTLAQALQQVMALPAVRARFQEMGAHVPELAPADFPAYVAKDAERWAQAATRAKVSTDD